MSPKTPTQIWEAAEAKTFADRTLPPTLRQSSMTTDGKRRKPFNIRGAAGQTPMISLQAREAQAGLRGLAKQAGESSSKQNSLESRITKPTSPTPSKSALRRQHQNHRRRGHKGMVGKREGAPSPEARPEISVESKAEDQEIADSPKHMMIAAPRGESH